MEWKYQHKRWNEVRMPLFFDIGDSFVYRCIESIKIWNGFIVKRYSKEIFLNHYKRKSSDSAKLTTLCLI